MELKVLSLFTGIGAFEKALSNIGIKYKLIGFSEIDKYAIESYCTIHNVDKSLNLGDITKIEKEKLPRFIDLITHGSPCQDFSVAGKQAGGDIGTGTRSSLMWNTVDIIEWCLPKYVVWENVKNLLSKKHRHNFDSYIEMMDKLGYNSYYEVLNAKDYGIPQNRERVYTISIRKDVDKGTFKFPQKEELKLRLKDMLEDEVDRKYYLKNYQIENIMKSNFNQNKSRIQKKDYCDTLCARDWKDPKCVQVGKGKTEPKIAVVGNYMPSNHDASRIVDTDGLAPTVKENHGTVTAIQIKNATKKGYDEAIEGDCINLQYPDSKTRRGRVGHQISQTLMANDSMGVVVYEEFNSLSEELEYQDYLETLKEWEQNGFEKEIPELGMTIRKLTPKECWRLMGFNDKDFEKAESIPISNTQLYKQAGNSIVVDVLEKIFRNLFKEI